MDKERNADRGISGAGREASDSVNRNLKLSWRVIPVREQDFADITITETAVGPEPVSEQQIREWEGFSRSDKDCPSEWLVAVDLYRKDHDAFLGWGKWGKGHWLSADEREVHVAVPPSKRRMGVGTFLLEHMEAMAKRDNPKAIYAWGRGYDKTSADWALKRGYEVARERTEGLLDLEGFDASKFQSDLDKVRGAGFDIRTVWDEGLEPHLPGLYKVSVETFHDVPFASTDPVDISYDDWIHEVKGSSARKLFAIAFHEGEIVGYSNVWMPQIEGQSAVIDYTGVLRPCRGKGIAFAVKVVATVEAAKAGVKVIRTNNDPDNPAILHLNERMGFKPVPGPIIFRKKVSSQPMGLIIS